jgi:RNA polymerase-associated protein
MLKLVRFPRSTNVERVALALAHKGIDVESVDVDPDDRSPVRELSGQDLVPVLIDGDLVLPDSTAILEHLEARFPEPPLYPADPARRAEVRIFIDWFNRVWKGPPNRMSDAIDAGAGEREAIARDGAWLQESLGLFEALLQDRDHLFGEFGAADCAAWPFLRYAAALDPDDPWTFHRVLHEHMRLDGRHPRLADWIDRMAARPMA